MKSAILAVAFGAASAAVPADEVTNFPGFGAPLTKTYSGYLDVGNGKHLHYLFFTSKGSPATDPVALWFNGGPGCSSLEGAFQENGPLWTTPGGATLEPNTYSVNNMSNALYLEAPACVGFSYSDSPNTGCSHNDTSTAIDNLAAVVAFFKAYPEFSTNPFWITGESYAGIYIPTLAYNVYNYNMGAASKINLKGIIVGNGCIGHAVGVCGTAGYGDYLSLLQLHGHGFVSDVAWAATLAACGDFSNENAACNNAIQAASSAVGNVDIYDLYSGIYGSCDYGNMKARRPIREGSVLSYLNKVGSSNNPCTTDTDLESYLNTPAVQTALHVKATTYQVCGGIRYTSDIADERTTIYPTLIEKAGIRVVIVSGEADACVPLTDSEWWTSSMNYTTVKAWSPWTVTETGSVGGYVTQYQHDFTFITVRGAGHMVPQMQPVAAWDIFHRAFNNLPWN